MKDIFIWTSDKKKYKRIDDWRVPELDSDGKLRDDCDGFVTYAHKLIREKFSKEEMQMTPIYAKTPEGGHVVLYIKYKERHFIFDNRQSKIVNLNFLKRRGYKDLRKPIKSVSGKWVKI